MKKKKLNETTQTPLTPDFIPEISISELGWADLKTSAEGEKIPSEQRSQLQKFLENIPGDDLQAKLKSLEDFFKADEAYLKEAGFVGQTNSDAVAKLMAYLVFYKTLTTIITHFNAASAGFSFESFLGVLLGGQQVPTNSQTIADLIDENDVYISLKLYKEGQLKVEGSFTDLCNDLIQRGYMQYVCVTKSLSGRGLEQSGSLDFYRFNFNLENVFNILSNSSKESQKCILLPKPFLDSAGAEIEGLPSKGQMMPSREVVESEFVSLLDKALQQHKTELEAEVGQFDDEKLRNAIDYANNQPLFGKNGVPGKTKISAMAVARSLVGLLGGKSTELKSKKLVNLIVKINNDIIVPKYSKEKLDVRRRETLNQLYFYDSNVPKLIETSRRFYENADAELKKRCLEVCLGYVDTRQFGLTQVMVSKIVALAGNAAGEIFPAGQNKIIIGTLQIGAANIQTMLTKVTGQLNQLIFDISNNLKVLTQNIQGYFAGGLTNDEEADNAKAAAVNIEKKTEKIQKGDVIDEHQLDLFEIIREELKSGAPQKIDLFDMIRKELSNILK
jgi:hypothetical protein